MKRPVLILSAVLLSGWLSFQARGMFAWYETKQVPIDRLFANLQQHLAADTNNFELTYDLARLHSMAYATNLASLGVVTNTGRPQFALPGEDSGVPETVHPPATAARRAKGQAHLTDAIRLYERAIVLLKQSTNAVEYKEWLVLPLELGYAWTLDQAGRRDEALAAYRKVLTLAWKREVTAQFSFKEWLDDKWNTVRAGSNPLRASGLMHSLGPGVCFSEETIGYLLKLLDPVKDAKEIARLKEKQKVLRGMGRAITPILVPLVAAAQLGDLVDPGAGVAFDLDGSGVPRRWGWITPAAAWLVFDPDGQGRITSGLQMFGNVTFWIFWRDGYDALRSLDEDQDGFLRGAELRGLALWRDRNSNGLCDPGEVRPVSDWGIAAIACSGESRLGGFVWCPAGVILADGESRPTYDWIVPSRAPGD